MNTIIKGDFQICISVPKVTSDYSRIFVDKLEYMILFTEKDNISPVAFNLLGRFSKKQV